MFASFKAGKQAFNERNSIHLGNEKQALSGRGKKLIVADLTMEKPTFVGAVCWRSGMAALLTVWSFSSILLNAPAYSVQQENIKLIL